MRITFGGELNRFQQPRSPGKFYPLDVEPDLAVDNPAHIQQVLDDLGLRAGVALDGPQPLGKVLLVAGAAPDQSLQNGDSRRTRSCERVARNSSLTQPTRFSSLRAARSPASRDSVHPISLCWLKYSADLILWQEASRRSRRWQYRLHGSFQHGDVPKHLHGPPARWSVDLHDQSDDRQVRQGRLLPGSDQGGNVMKQRVRSARGPRHRPRFPCAPCTVRRAGTIQQILLYSASLVAQTREQTR